MKETMTLKISSVNQITLPSFARKKLGIGAGDEVDVKVEGDSIILQRAETREEQVKRMMAKLDKLKEEREKHMTPEQRRFQEMARGWTVHQLRDHIDSLPETKAYIEEKYNVKVA